MALLRRGDLSVTEVCFAVGCSSLGTFSSRRSGIEKRRSRRATTLTPMDVTIHASLLPHDDPDASVGFYRDTLGFEVRNDVEYGGMH